MRTTINSALQHKIFTTLLFISVFSSSIVHAQMVTGTYTGDGTSSQAITGLGSSPTVLIVIPNTGGAASGEIQTWIHTTSMAAGKVKYTTGGNSVANSFKSNFLTSLDASGFTVGSKANVSGTLYYYIAWSSADGNIAVGTFTGSTSTTNVAVGFAPAMVWLFSDNVLSPDYMKWSHSSRPGGTYRFSHGDGGWGEYSFKSFSPVGFSVHPSTYGGTGILNGSTYHYVAFTGSIAVANPGWGSGPDKITTSYAPGFMMTRHSTTHGNNTYIKTSDMPSNTSFIPRHETGVTNAIQNFQSDGYDVGNTGQLRDKHYYFGIESAVTLPVELIKFEAKEVNFTTTLNWTTGSEINNSHFDILGSLDGNNWQLLGTVPGAGNSENMINYSEDLAINTHRYYKLRQVDYDGKQAFSKVISLDREHNFNSAMIYPNPATNSLYIDGVSLSEEKYSAEIINVNGSVVFSKEINFREDNFKTEMNISDLPEGIYFLNLISVSGNQFSKQFVKK